MRMLLMVFLIATVGRADAIYLENGSVVNGKIKTIYQSKMVVETDFAGEIEIKMDQVNRFSTDAEMNVQLKSGTNLTGRIESTNAEIKVVAKTEELNSEATVKAKAVKMLWPVGDDAPDYKTPFKKEWKTVVSAGYIKKTGNTDEVTANIDAVATLTGEDDKLKLYARYTNSETAGERTDDETILGIDYEALFSEKGSWYTRIEGEKDAFEDIEVRLTLAAGYGHYFIKEERMSLRGRVGLFYRYESYKSSRSDDSTWGPDLGIRYEYTSLNDWSWYTDFSCTPSIEKASDLQAKHESAFVAPIGSTNWAFKIGLRHEFNNTPSSGKERLDTTYFTNLQLKF